MRRACWPCRVPAWSYDRPGSLFLNWGPAEARNLRPYAHLTGALLVRELGLAVRMDIDMGGFARHNWPTEFYHTDPMSLPPDLMLEIMGLRTKEAAGNITDDELRRAVQILREGRVQAAVASRNAKAATASSAKTQKPSGDDVLSLFNNLSA